MKTQNNFQKLFFILHKTKTIMFHFLDKTTQSISSTQKKYLLLQSKNNKKEYVSSEY